MSQWITEEQTPHLRLSAEAEEVLYSGESEFQKIEVFKSKEYGMMLALDGVFQTSEREEFIYHEMIAHVPLFLHPNPERVLIIGGGDGGVARECVRHDCVETVTMIEIDGKVLEVIPGGKYKVELANGYVIEAHVSGKIRMNMIRILPGDTVTIELSPYDLTRGRITWNKR